jgi:hypothetical protein
VIVSPFLPLKFASADARSDYQCNGTLTRVQLTIRGMMRG